MRGETSPQDASGKCLFRYGRRLIVPPRSRLARFMLQQPSNKMEQFVLELAAPPAPTFATFVAGGNAAALLALQLHADGRLPHRAFYLWGQSGVGRTHLLHAAVHAAVAARRSAAYVDAGSLHADSSIDRNLDLIAIDNVNGLTADGAQRVFEWFTRQSDGRDGIVLAADGPPASLAARADVRSRFGSGIVFEIVPLSDAEKHAALRAHAMARGLPELDEVFRYLLARADRNLGTLISVIDTLDRYTLSTKRPPTLPLVRQILQQLRAPQQIANGTDSL